MIISSKNWLGTRAPLKLLSRLVRTLQRRLNRVTDVLDGGARQKRQALQKARQRRVRGETAQIQLKANAVELQSNHEILSNLEELISARIGRPVRHVRSEIVLKPADKGLRAHEHRRAYTKHWFDVRGVVDDRLPFDTDGLLRVFVKSGSKLGLCPPLEFILSEQGGNGFRTPYFFGSFTLSGLRVAAWEGLEPKRVAFAQYPRADQNRIIEAIAHANVVPAERTVPVRARWLDFDARQFKYRFGYMEHHHDEQWRSLYARTADVLKGHRRLVDNLVADDARFLTHNDVNTDNIYVPPTGDIVLFDWEIATLSVPGADLGLLARANAGASLLECYVSKMAQFGVELDADTVRFTLEVVAGIRTLYRGWQSLSVREAETGLALLTRHLDHG